MQTTNSIFLFVQIHNGIHKSKFIWKICFNMILMKNRDLVPIGRNNHPWNLKLHLKRDFILGEWRGGGEVYASVLLYKKPK